MDTVRVIRVYEFSGPREQVEAQIARSLQDGVHSPSLKPGSPWYGKPAVTVRVATLGPFPETVVPDSPVYPHGPLPDDGAVPPAEELEGK